MKSAEIRDRMLVAALTLSRRVGFDFHMFTAVEREAGVTIPTGLGALLLQQLIDAGLIENVDEYTFIDEEEPSDGEYPSIRLNWNGIQAAESLLDQHPEYDSNSIPASDRYVTINDNQKADIKGELKVLEDAFRGDNAVSEEERQIALSEIAIFEATIAAPVLAADIVERFVNRVLKWIMATFSAAGVAEVAQRLIQGLSGLV